MAAILVVDDHPSFRAIVRDVLISAGHTVCEASDGRDASRLVGRRRYDLVITDMMMPDMDGIEVIIELRRMSTQTKILAVSSPNPSPLRASSTRCPPSSPPNSSAPVGASKAQTTKL
jgi:CheY-like chemotaxis protein